jgi:ABC-type transport system involved in multi-copper enzyme maturation permease subunit
MQHGNLKWLVWKEYRQNLFTVAVMFFLMLAPYAVSAVISLIAWRWNWHVPPEMRHWMTWLAAASWFSLFLTQLPMALIGGNAIAGEVADRSQQFQAYLPIPRSRLITAKLLLALLMFTVIWLPYAIIFGGFLVFEPRPSLHNLEAVSGTLLNVAITGLTFFCVAWLFSSLLGSPVVAVCAGLITPVLAWSLPALAMWAHGFEHYTGQFVPAGYASFGHGHIALVEAILEFWAQAICLTASAIGLALGAWLYLRRAET